MPKDFDFSALKKYEEIFGKEKITNLFKEYLKEHVEQMLKVKIFINSNKFNDLRIIYHSLRSASMVFSMNQYAKLCEKIEAAALRNEEIDKINELIEESNKIYETEVSVVKKYLGVI